MSMLALGIIAASLQAIGYLAYGFKILRHDIEPNATSWLMFAYGTALLVIVEWDRDATLPILILPTVCALLSIVIAFYCIRRARRMWWPEHPLEKFSFILDILLTVLYVSSWILISKGLITGLQKDNAEMLILICWNIGVFTAFFPLLRQVYLRPLSEHALPWYLWTIAYAILFFITYQEIGSFNELMLYPYTNLVVHGIIAIRTGYAHHRAGHSIL